MREVEGKKNILCFLCILCFSSLGLKRSVPKFPMGVSYQQTPRPLAPTLPASLALSTSMIFSLCCTLTLSFFFPLTSFNNTLVSSTKKLLPQSHIPRSPPDTLYLSLAIHSQTSREGPRSLPPLLDSPHFSSETAH